MNKRFSLRASIASALLAAACVAVAAPAIADPGYTQDNKVSLLLRNESGCTVTAESFRNGSRVLFVTIGNGHMWQAYNVGQYRLEGTATCGATKLKVVPHDVNLSKSSPQTIILRRNSAGEVYYQ